MSINAKNAVWILKSSFLVMPLPNALSVAAQRLTRLCPVLASVLEMAVGAVAAAPAQAEIAEAAVIKGGV